MDMRLTYQPLSLCASGMSGFIIRVLLKDAESDRPPKSESFAPLMAKMGCPEPSNFSACDKKKTRDMDKVKTLYYLYRCCLDLFCSVVNQEESIDSSVAVRLYISMLKSS